MLDFGFYNMDCMEGMKEFPDKYFDLAVVDPPYGIGASRFTYELGKSQLAPAKAFGSLSGGGKLKNSVLNKMTTEWDKKPPNAEYFAELNRVSKNQVIWGGITLICRQHVELFVGIKNNHLTILVNGKWRGHHLTNQRSCSGMLMLVSIGKKRTHAFTQRRNQLHFTNGYCRTTQRKVTKYLILMLGQRPA